MNAVTETGRRPEPTTSEDMAAAARASSWILLVGFFLVMSAARAVYFAREATPSTRFEFLCALSFITFLWFWLKEQCRPHGTSFPLDMPWFAALLWFVLVPYYLWRYERWRGVLKCVALAAAYALCHALSLALH